MNKPLEVLQEKFPELASWLKPMCRYNRNIEDVFIIDYKNKILGLTFYTKDNYYSISARLPNKFSECIILKDKDNNIIGESSIPINDGYLGCMVNTRKPRAGESWNRGRDLSDGSYSEDTWKKILNDIIAYELVKVVKQKKIKLLV